MTSCITGWICVVVLVLGADSVNGQNYPSKPIRIVASPVGGSGDFHARLIAQGISASLGQPVVVENRGGGGNILGEIAAKAAPDGYTLLNNGSSFWIGPLLQKAPYDPVKDFAPVTSTTSSPNILVIHPSIPVKSVKELIAYAKARPGELNYASGVTGSEPHLLAELFKAMAGIDIVRIAYKGTGLAVSDLLGGQVQLLFGSAASVAPHLKTGRLTPLAVTSARPSSLYPNLPTVGATLPGYASASMQGIWAPAGTPRAIVNRLNQEIARFINSADVKEKLFNIGVEPDTSSPEEFAAVIKSETVRMAKIIKQLGIRPE